MSQRFRRGITLVFAGFIASATGCSSGHGGPTLAKAGADLVAAGETALKDPNSAGYKITDPGTDLPCGRGRAKRTFAGAGTMGASGADLDGYLDGARRSINGGIGSLGLGFVLDPSSLGQADDLIGREVLFTRKDGELRLRIRIHPNSSAEEFGKTPAGRSPGPYEVTGETGCLKIK